MSDRRGNRHHIWYPKRDYTTRLERRFRELPCGIVFLPVRTHNLLHALQAPPKNPSRFEMAEAIWSHERGDCTCTGRGGDPGG